MSLEQMSHTSKRFESPLNPRISFLESNLIHTFNPSDASSTPKQQDGYQHPLKAALGVKLSYVATLRESLIMFLDNLVEKSIRLFLDYFYRDVKYQANSSDPANLPKSIKQNGLVTLQSKDEVTECKDYQNTPRKYAISRSQSNQAKDYHRIHPPSGRPSSSRPQTPFPAVHLQTAYICCSWIHCGN